MTNDDGRLYYEASRFGRAIIERSRLGLLLNDGLSLADRLTVMDASASSVDETWEQVWGEKRLIRNRYNELRVELSTGGDEPLALSVVFRVYDDGFGFRYEVPEQPHLTAFHILDELTESALHLPMDRWGLITLTSIKQPLTAAVL